MPQLWTETIVTQYFWLVVILLGFYYLAVTKFIPQIAFTLKARRTLEATGSESKTSTDIKDSAAGSSRELLSTILTPRVPTIKTTAAETLKSEITTVRSNWINQYIK